jgi:hypothetical protein
VFHVQSYYVRQQAPPFKVRKCVADQQPWGTIPRQQERLFLRLSIRTDEKLWNSRRWPSSIDFRPFNIHTSRYVSR